MDGRSTNHDLALCQTAWFPALLPSKGKGGEDALRSPKHLDRKSTRRNWTESGSKLSPRLLPALGASLHRHLNSVDFFSAVSASLSRPSALRVARCGTLWCSSQAWQIATLHNPGFSFSMCWPRLVGSSARLHWLGLFLLPFARLASTARQLLLWAGLVLWGKFLLTSCATPTRPVTAT